MVGNPGAHRAARGGGSDFSSMARQRRPRGTRRGAIRRTAPRRAKSTDNEQAHVAEEAGVQREEIETSAAARAPRVASTHGGSGTREVAPVAEPTSSTSLSPSPLLVGGTSYRPSWRSRLRMRRRGDTGRGPAAGNVPGPRGRERGVRRRTQSPLQQQGQYGQERGHDDQSIRTGRQNLGPLAIPAAHESPLQQGLVSRATAQRFRASPHPAAAAAAVARLSSTSGARSLTLSHRGRPAALEGTGDTIRSSGSGEKADEETGTTHDMHVHSEGTDTSVLGYGESPTVRDFASIAAQSGRDDVTVHNLENIENRPVLQRDPIRTSPSAFGLRDSRVRTRHVDDEGQSPSRALRGRSRRVLFGQAVTHIFDSATVTVQSASGPPSQSPLSLRPILRRQDITESAQTAVPSSSPLSSPMQSPPGARSPRRPHQRAFVAQSPPGHLAGGRVSSPGALLASPSRESVSIVHSETLRHQDGQPADNRTELIAAMREIARLTTQIGDLRDTVRKQERQQAEALADVRPSTAFRNCVHIVLKPTKCAIVIPHHQPPPPTPTLSQ